MKLSSHLVPVDLILSLLRTNAADYLCPELFKIDSDFGPLMIEEIRQLSDESRVEHILWGVVSVVLHARLLSKSGGDVIASGAVDVKETYGSPPPPGKLRYRPLTTEELELVCLRYCLSSCI